MAESSKDSHESLLLEERETTEQPCSSQASCPPPPVNEDKIEDDIEEMNKDKAFWKEV